MSYDVVTFKCYIVCQRRKEFLWHINDMITGTEF